MRHKIVLGLGFGDEGKGTVVDYLCRQQEIHAVVRFSGGAQAAHNVVTPDGVHHTFAQFGSGTLTATQTYLSRFMLVNPLNMMAERTALMKKVKFDPLHYTFVDREALLTTPFHAAANKIRETARGEDRHGSCGQGIGETRLMQNKGLMVTVADMQSPNLLTKLTLIRDAYQSELGFGVFKDVATPREIAGWYRTIAGHMHIVGSETLDMLLDTGPCVFEGSQGVLLDEWHGFHPYTTWSTTTPANALVLLNGRESSTLGVTRSYMTRHGAGPFPSELAGKEGVWPEQHNQRGHFQGGWRRGNLDLVLLDYANRVCGGVDELAVTHLDRELWPVVTDYMGGGLKTKAEAGRRVTDLTYQESLTRRLLDLAESDLEVTAVADAGELLELLEGRLQAPVTLRSTGWSASDKTVVESSHAR